MATTKRKTRSSGDYCAVVGCRNCGYKKMEWMNKVCTEPGHDGLLHKYCPCLVPFSFNVFPRFPKERQKWVECIKRKNYIPNRRAVVCSVHFVDRKPTPANPYPTLRLDNPYLKDPNKTPLIKKKLLAVQESAASKITLFDKPVQKRQENIFTFADKNVVPKIVKAQVSNPSHVPPVTEGTRKSSRLQDDSKREKARQLNLTDRFIPYESEDENENNNSQNSTKSELLTSLGLKKMQQGGSTTFELHTIEMETSGIHSKSNLDKTIETSDVSTQWEDMVLCPSVDHSYSFSNRNTKRVRTITSSGFQCNLLCFTSKLMNDSDLYFYAGLSKGTFGRLVKLLQTEGDVEPFQMTIENQILLVLVHLRLGLLIGDLSRRFNVSTLIVTKVLLYWLPIMVEELGKLIIWLPKESIQDTLPECFQNTYPETTCILGCTELLVGKPENHWENDDSNNNNECNNSYRCLVAVAPDGTIMFVSDCYKKQFTNNYIVENCGILNYLSPGDEVITEQDFMVRDVLPPGVKHTVPSFDEEESPFLEEQGLDSQISNVKLHTQKVTNRLRNFRILNSCVPLPEGTALDDIVVLCAALCNLQPRAIES